MATRPKTAKQLSLATAKAPDTRAANGDAHQRAMARAGRWLALRPLTVAEMRRRLTAGGFDTETIEGAIARLLELGLLDDLAFAEQLVEERARKGLGPEALRAELEAKGIDSDTAEAALAGSRNDETQRATEVAAKLLKRLVDRPLPKQAASLQQGLARRGFSEEAVGAAVRTVLPPEGWD